MALVDPSPMNGLRSYIRRLERTYSRPCGVLPFALAAIDTHLPEGGLCRAALHEVMGGGADAVRGASAALFAAGILGRLDAPVLWCGTRRDLYPPGLACAGLHPDRLLLATAETDKAVLMVMEDALRCAGLGAVLGELEKLPDVASRRLALAAEKSGVMALALRRRREGRPEDTAPNAASTRWRITPLPSRAPARPGIDRIMGRPRWEVALTRCRGGEAALWTMEACDAQGRLALPAVLAGGTAAPAIASAA